jgi:hypothetical protein
MIKVTGPNNATDRKDQVLGIVLVRYGRCDRVMHLQLGSRANCAQKASEGQELKGEFISQLRASVCRDDRENFGWTRLRFIAVNQSDRRIGQIVHKDKKSGRGFAGSATVYGAIPRAASVASRIPERLQQAFVWSVVTAEFGGSVPNLVPRIPPV